MREFYPRYTSPTPQTVTQDIAEQLDHTRRTILQKSDLIWAEHCSECAMPACFSYCEYYTPRMDLKCQRFENGIVPVCSSSGKASEAFSVHFAKWGKLEASGTAKLKNLSGSFPISATGRILEKALRWLPVPYLLHLYAARAFNKVQKILSQRGTALTHCAGSSRFLIETVNKGPETELTFTIRETGNPENFFQKLVRIPTGYCRTFIRLSEISNVLLDSECLYQIEPATSGTYPDIIFGTLDFVALKDELPESGQQVKSSKVKCVIWDLDNTLWDGTLIEDGISGIRLRPEMIATITRLDSMGILNSVASKNNHDDAMEAIRRFGLEEYFLYPQISWNPKSNSIKTIQKSLNIGMDTLVFIDDQIFERTEVSETLPEVRVFTDRQVSEIMELPEFQVPVTEESRQRRKMYQEDMIRTEAMESSGSDYTEFLKSCRIELILEPLSEASLERVHELSQRTNQMNFSGNRYTRGELAGIAKDKNKKTFVISCKDRFGSYGIVGFAIVDEPGATLEDLMFSCRIQAKQVEHTFFNYQFAIYKAQGRNAFHANYRPTKKNAQAGKVFTDTGFVLAEEKDGIQKLIYDLGQFTEQPPIMKVIYIEASQEDLKATA